MDTSVNNGHSKERFEKPLMENGDHNHFVKCIYKRRKVSATRDFPKGCGPISSRVDPGGLKVDIAGFGSANGTTVEDKNDEHSGNDDVRTSMCEENPQHSALKQGPFLTETLGQTIDCSLYKENPLISSHHVDQSALANDEPAKVPLVGMEALEDTELTRTANSVNCDSSYMSMGSSPIGEVVLSVGPESLSPIANIDVSSASMENAETKRSFPRRKVSAFRDFPPFCGRNASCLRKEECHKISSMNRVVGSQNLNVDDNPLKEAAPTDMKQAENSVEDKPCPKRKLGDIVQADSEGNVPEKVKKLDVFEPSSRVKLKLPQKITKEKYITLHGESNHYQVEINSNVAVEEANLDFVEGEGTSGLEIIVHPEVQSLEAKPLQAVPLRAMPLRAMPLQAVSDRKVVLGLMSESECPWRSERSSSKVKSIGNTNEKKGKKAEYSARLDRSKAAIKTKDGLNHSAQKPLKKREGNSVSKGTGQLVISEKDSLDPNESIEDFQVVTESHDFNVNVPPFGHHNISANENDSNVTRNKVRETLRLFQAVSRKLLQEVEAKPSERANTQKKRIDLQAAKILREKGKYVNSGKHIIGPVPGVEVGDEFQYRVELNIIGLHRQLQGGIDYVKHKGKIVATSIVASGGYANDLDNSDVLIYTGQGGNVMNTDKEPEDQKLERGNLALNNSLEEQNSVRVMRGSESVDGKCKTYVYDGLYKVEACWQDMGPHGKLVYKFRLRREPGQPELALKEVRKSKKFKTREGLCVDDISDGKERIPICAVNTIDDEKPPSFKYITSMMYPDCDLIPPQGCDCTNGCSDSKKCSCVVKNGGEIPFNHNGAIVEAKPLVYECGPSCKCPSTCHNRVSQHGIKFQLEIFKTNKRGWGVRSLNSIPSGSFICEYMGELLEDKEAEQRTGNDEYLFDIGNNYSNSTLWDGLSTLIPDAQSSSSEVVKDGGFTIDAAQYGNVGRFINHSCSPNLYAQNVLYDHHDNRMPHIMLFAAENIPPLQELAYDYNYMIGQVRDSDGNIKKKDCFCGSAECTGRMY